ncbi:MULTISPECIES: glycosyltransferase family 39 protein [unclassified Rathayibacter]|uniref:glycosyltransferase family 39 protein n=1 Tax=unclassified Rathayibacter TaxID=2609250 RepID=UPI000F4B0EEC|nr:MULTISPECIES: glycosyltransferase family 39 protein [unclassified Rathayibacter]ROP57473.1 mannosyltransferase [Rathayibacter sp. PhB186]ROS55858.1 mannosyltransferase [Rathayibacter sp. PhB185]
MRWGIRARGVGAESIPASAVLLVATLLTLLGSWIPSYWNDEAATLRLARLPLPELLAFAQQKDAVHVVYALLMHGWIAIAGESELAVRAPSALAAGAGAAGVLVLLRSLGRPRAALLAAIVFVLLPRTSFNGTEARSSALATALVVWAAVLAVRAARDGGVLRWAGFVAVAGLANAVFLYCVLVLPAFVLLAAVVGPRRGRAFGAGVLGAVLSVGVASPVIVTAAGQSGQIGWLRSQPVNAYTVVVESFFGSAWWLAALAVGLLVVAAVRTRAVRSRATVAGAVHPPLVLVLAVWLLLPAAVLLLGTALIEPMFTPRYLSLSSPALATVLGLALASWRPVTAGVLVGALAVAALPALVLMRTETGKPAGQDLRALAQTIQAGARPGDAFLLGDSGTVSLRPRIALAAYPSAFAGLDDVALERSYATTGTYSDVLVGDDALRTALAGEQRVWTAAPASDPAAFDWLAAEGFEAGLGSTVPTATITLWERR